MSVIIYRYDSSPFSVKIDNVLLLKNIPHHKVNVKSLLPRPEITEFLGLGYRRIPILAIGNDIYCDTSLIASALERRFPPAQGYGTIYPERNDGSYDTGIIKSYAKHYADNVIFPLVPVLLPWEKFPQEFIKDRSQYSGNQISPAAMASSRGKSLSTLTSHIALAEEQLSDGRQWLFNTSVPSLADVALHFPLAWGKTLPGAKNLIDDSKFPNVAKWLSRLAGRIIELKKNLKVDKMSGKDAAKTIASSPHEADDVVGFDPTESARLGFKKGDIIQIAPDDTGRAFPTVGQLVGLNVEEFVIETTSSFGTFRCHFPRIGFSVRFPKQAKQKL